MASEARLGMALCLIHKESQVPWVSPQLEFMHTWNTVCVVTVWLARDLSSGAVEVSDFVSRYSDLLLLKGGPLYFTLI